MNKQRGNSVENTRRRPEGGNTPRRIQGNT